MQSTMSPAKHEKVFSAEFTKENARVDTHNGGRRSALRPIKMVLYGTWPDAPGCFNLLPGTWPRAVCPGSVNLSSG